MRTSVAYDRASAAAVIGCFRWGVWAASLGLMTCLATGAMAQDTDDEWLRSYYNLERSHIDHPWGKGLIFEAQLAPQDCRGSRHPQALRRRYPWPPTQNLTGRFPSPSRPWCGCA